MLLAAGLPHEAARQQGQTGPVPELLRAGTPAGRWVIAATVLGSGIAFLDGSVVNVALPTIGRDLDTDLAGLPDADPKAMLSKLQTEGDAVLQK